MKNTWIYLLLFLIFSCQHQTGRVYEQLEGLAFGTSFHISLDDQKNGITEKEIDSLIHSFNKSLSTYMPDSDISRINRGDTNVIVDAYFKEVFKKSEKIFDETDGAFDPTIGILVNAWGFGPGPVLKDLGQEKVDSLLIFVGFDQLELNGDRLIKQHPETYLDFNANAKGFAVDVIGRYLESKGIFNYMVEIGGEIRARGKNQKNEPWRIAIEKPNFDGTRSFQTIIALENESIATSGNYRKYKIDSVSGEKYAHTIDTKTGYPSKSNLLSASVISDLDCSDVDAYATAFMAMGFERTREFAERHPELKVFLIYSNKDGELKTFKSSHLNLENP